jgi:hypothetical protein
VTAITSWKANEINYEAQFTINPILNNEIEEKNQLKKH